MVINSQHFPALFEPKPLWEAWGWMGLGEVLDRFLPCSQQRLERRLLTLEGTSDSTYSGPIPLHTLGGTQAREDL